MTAFKSILATREDKAYRLISRLHMLSANRYNSEECNNQYDRCIKLLKSLDKREVQALGYTFLLGYNPREVAVKMQLSGAEAAQTLILTALDNANEVIDE